MKIIRMMISFNVFVALIPIIKHNVVHAFAFARYPMDNIRPCIRVTPGDLFFCICSMETLTDLVNKVLDEKFKSKILITSDVDDDNCFGHILKDHRDVVVKALSCSSHEEKECIARGFATFCVTEVKNAHNASIFTQSVPMNDTDNPSKQLKTRTEHYFDCVLDSRYWRHGIKNQELKQTDENKYELTTIVDFQNITYTLTIKCTTYISTCTFDKYKLTARFNYEKCTNDDLIHHILDGDIYRC